MIDIYILLTARVPIPRMLFLFSVVTLSMFTVSASRYMLFVDAGMVMPVMCVLLGHVAVIGSKLGSTVATLTRLGVANPAAKLIPIYLATYAAMMAVPSLEMAQTALSVVIAAYIGLFVFVLYFCSDGDKLDWFGRTWTAGQRNAANWNVARLVAFILLNETVARHGTPTDWIIAVTLGPITLHYLMYWTILATHPHDEATRSG